MSTVASNPVQTAPRVLEYNDQQHAETVDDLIEGEHGYKYRMLEGRVMPPYVTPNRYELSRRLEMRNTDICFTSYPKSGSNWLSYILVLLTGCHRGSTLRDSLHWVESSFTYPRSEDDLQQAPDPRIFKSHMPYDMAVGGVPHRAPCKYIYIARNPKDVCVSYYNFESSKSWAGFYSGGWDHWFQMFLDGRVQRGDWFDHALSWWEHKDDDNILFLKYEDMKKDIDAELRKIAAFLDIQVSQPMLEDIKEKVGFTAMKNEEFSAMRDVKELSRFFRKGEVGSWKEQFTVHQNEVFDIHCQGRLGLTGLTFDYD